MRLRPLFIVPLVLLSGLTACRTMQGEFTFGPKPVPPPVPVRELEVVVPPEAQMPIVLQFRERNVLVVDLTGVASTGTVELRPGAAGTWPVRLALRFQPGRFEVVEAKGAGRVVIPVTEDRSGGAATASLPPTVHPAATPALTLRWGSRADF